MAAPEPLGAWPRLWLSGLGAGRLAPAPGTWASASVVVLAAAAEWWLGAGLACAAGFVVVGSLVTLAWGGRAVDRRGGGDPGWVVSDEWAGQGLALLAAAPGLDPRLWLAAFALFRLFDIAKPGPIRSLERVPGGLGVLLDDLGAGLLAGLLVLGLQVLLQA